MRLNIHKIKSKYNKVFYDTGIMRNIHIKNDIDRISISLRYTDIWLFHIMHEDKIIIMNYKHVLKVLLGMNFSREDILDMVEYCINAKFKLPNYSSAYFPSRPE